MDIDTTSINELPVIQNIPSVSSEEDLEKAQLSNARHQLDHEIINHQNASHKKNVRFENDSNIEQTREFRKNDAVNSNFNDDDDECYGIGSSGYELSLTTKIIILATFIFFFFMDPKIRKYLMNILVQIFGAYLKTEHNNLSQIGILVYSLFFGLVLYVVVSTIDISSFHLAF